MSTSAGCSNMLQKLRGLRKSHGFRVGFVGGEMIWKTGACIKKVGFGASSNVYAIIGVHVILGCSKLFSMLFEKQKAPHYV